MAETASWSLVCIQSFKAWWRETTNIVVLNSPLLNRATGNAFRCITLCSLTFMTLRHYDALMDEQNRHWLHENWLGKIWTGFLSVGTLILIIGSIASLLAIVWKRRESVRSSWFYCFITAVSLQLVIRAQQVRTEETRFLYMLAVLCHCNFHPIPLLLVIGSMFCHLYSAINFGGNFMGSFETIDTLWCTAILLLMFCAFTHDFTVRVKAISTGMILPQEGGQPHDSPLSGRSARSICWLMVLSNWLAWGSLTIEKASYKTQVGKHYEYLFENRLPICTWLVPLVLFASIFGLWVSGSRGGRCALWQADLTMFICSCTPPAMIFANLMLLDIFDTDKPEPFRVEFALQFQTRVQSMVFIAGQTLVQAGCQPIVCIGPFAAYLISISSKGGTVYFLFNPEEIASSLALSLFIWIGYTAAYVTRYRAIREGLERARKNAASTQSFLDSIHPHRPGVELQGLPEAKAPRLATH